MSCTEQTWRDQHWKGAGEEWLQPRGQHIHEAASSSGKAWGCTWSWYPCAVRAHWRTEVTLSDSVRKDKLGTKRSVSLAGGSSLGKSGRMQNRGSSCMVRLDQGVRGGTESGVFVLKGWSIPVVLCHAHYNHWPYFPEFYLLPLLWCFHFPAIDRQRLIVVCSGLSGLFGCNTLKDLHLL